MSEPDPIEKILEGTADYLEVMVDAMAEQSGSEPDGPVGNDDGYTDGEAPHDVEECTDPDCPEPECRRQRDMLEADRRYDEMRDREMEEKS